MVGKERNKGLEANVNLPRFQKGSPLTPRRLLHGALLRRSASTGWLLRAPAGGSWYYDRGSLFQGRRYADLLYTCGKSMAAAPQPYADSFFSSASVCARSRYTLAENPSVPLPGLTRIPTPIPYTLAENLSVAFLILTPVPSSLPRRLRPLLCNP